MAKKRSQSRSKYSESKSKLGISLTPTGIKLLNELADKASLSKSELVEQLARGAILLGSNVAKASLVITGTKDAEKEHQIKYPSQVSDIQFLSDRSLAPIPPTGEINGQTQSLETELAAQKQLVQELQAQLGQNLGETDQQLKSFQDALGKITQLRQQLAAKDATIAQLSQGDSEPATDPQAEAQRLRLAQLEQQLSDRQREITQLQQQLAARDQALHQAQTIPAPNTDPEEITRLKTQLAQLQTLGQKRLAEQERLKAQIQRMIFESESLRAQLSQVSTLASIGEQSLSKWHYRSI